MIDLTVESVNDELNVLRGHALYRFLDHVVAVLVLDALEHT